MSHQKYKQIDTKHYRIIYDNESEEMAKKAADIVEKYYNENNKNLYSKNNQKINILLNDVTLISNGMYTIGPEYSLLYTLPPQMDTFSLYYNDWFELLAVHEMRHKVQFHFLNRGYNRLLYILFGDLGWGAGLGMSAPGWFYEGDAVYHETDLTKTGRGRTAHFTELTKSMIMGNNEVTYDRMYLGSNYNVYPNIYETGYLLTSYMRKQYGPDIFSDILKYSSSWDFLLGPYSFQMGVYVKTGKNIYSIFNDMVSSLKEEWLNELKAGNFNEYDPLFKKNKNLYISYNNPFGSQDGKIIYAYKTGRFHTRSIVAIDENGKEKTLVIPSALSGNINVNNQQITWSENLPDIRWDDTHSVIRVLDINTGKIRNITGSRRLFSPSVSYNGKYIAAIEAKKNGKTALKIIDSSSGKIIKEAEPPLNALWQTPRWGTSSDEVSILQSDKNGKTIALFNISNSLISYPMKYINHQVSDPFLYNNYIFFHSDLSGIDNIFAVNLNSGKIYQVTNSFYGTYQPSVSKNGKVFFSNFSKEGYYISSVSFEPKKWKEAVEVNPLIYTSFQENVSQKAEKEPERSLQNYDSKNYSSFLNSFNFHSRYINPLELLNNNIALTLKSNNILQTQIIRLDYKYNYKENIHNIRGEWEYRGWFPVFKIGANYGFNRGFEKDFRQLAFSENWDEASGYLQVNVPLTFSDGPVLQFLQPGIESSYTSIKNTYFNGTPIFYDNYSGLRARAFLKYNFHIRGNSILFDHPYFYTTLGINYGPDVSVFNEHRGYLESTMMLIIPGFYYNHQIILRGSLSHRDAPFDQIFSSEAFIGRGMSTGHYTKSYLASVDYYLPLFYPDFNIFSIIYIRQFSLNLFYERVWFEPFHPKFDQYTGIDLICNYNIFQLDTEIIGGARFIYYFNENSNAYTIDPLLYISLLSQF